MVNLSIIVINYNTKELTLKCVDSVFKQYKNEFEKENFEVILIDNASPDNSGKELKELLQDKKWLTFIESKENLGFGRGNNKAAESAKGKYLLFLNSDTEVLDDGLLGMIDFMNKNEKVGVIGGRLENPDGTNQRSAMKYYHPFNLFLMLYGFEKHGFLRSSPVNITKVDWVSGASLMIKRDLFESLNGFDKNIFMYIEDMELCFRVQKAGFDVFFYPNIKIVHKEGKSSNRTFAILNIYKGIQYFYKTHWPKSYNIAACLLKSKALFAILIGTLTFRKNVVDTYLKAIKI